MTIYTWYYSDYEPINIHTDPERSTQYGYGYGSGKGSSAVVQAGRKNMPFVFDSGSGTSSGSLTNSHDTISLDNGTCHGYGIGNGANLEDF